MIDQAVRHASDYMQQDVVNKDDVSKALKMRRWIIGHEYGAPITHCMSSWTALIMGSLEGTGPLLSRA